MAQRQLVIPGPVVKKSNALARASWSVKSVYEPRLVALVASRVHVDDKDFQDYEISIQELLGTADTGGKSYKLVSDVVGNLLGRVVTLPKTHGWVKCTIFSRVEYDGKAGVVRVRFDPSLKDHYLNLKSHFTQYSLMEFLLLPSTYSQRLFEILNSWNSISETVIPLEDLFSMLNVPPTLQRYPDFRRKVLERAHKDITGKTGLTYTWEPIKQGRAVHSIRFTFGDTTKQIESKKVSEQVQKSSQKNNALFKKAIDCWAFHTGIEKICDPENSERCNLCKRFNWAKKNPSDPSFSQEKASVGVQNNLSCAAVTSDQFVKTLRDYGLNNEAAHDIVTRLIKEGLL